MRGYTWGVDGLGRQHICERHGMVVVMCVIPGSSAHECIELLESTK